MRRSFLTATVPVAGAPFTVGETNLTNTAGGGGFTFNAVISTTSPAPGNGTLSQVKFTAPTGGGGTTYFFTGSLTGSTLVVTAVSPSFTAAVGANTFSVSLAINAGDYVGWFSAVGDIAGNNTANTSWAGSPPHSPPLAGDSFSVANSSFPVCLQGTGS